MSKNPHAVALGRTGGRATSTAKTEAARRNGKKGGRPLKVRQQTVVIEWHDPEWWVMLDNGQILVCDTAAAALTSVKSAAKRGNRDATITTIEWRNVPAGFQP